MALFLFGECGNNGFFCSSCSLYWCKRLSKGACGYASWLCLWTMLCVVFVTYHFSYWFSPSCMVGRWCWYSAWCNCLFPYLLPHNPFPPYRVYVSSYAEGVRWYASSESHGDINVCVGCDFQLLLYFPYTHSFSFRSRDDDARFGWRSGWCGSRKSFILCLCSTSAGLLCNFSQSYFSLETGRRTFCLALAIYMERNEDRCTDGVTISFDEWRTIGFYNDCSPFG